MFDIQENLKKLPDKPGVYMHKDRLGQVIYVGKAISLKKRVRQYFQSPGRLDLKVRAMVSHIAEFEYITCKTEMEALILECNLIKKYMPRYNVVLRDDKTYPYIVVTITENYPRVLKTRILKKDGNRYFGPYSAAGAVNEIVDLFSSTYRLKRCNNDEFPEGFRPCLNFHIKECRGICTGEVDREEYMEAIDEIIQFLSGKDRPLIRRLESLMNKASEAMDYEMAARYRDKLEAAKALSETQRVTMIGKKDMDILVPVKDRDSSFMALFPVRDGKLSGRETFQIQSDDEDTREEILSEFIKQYYSQWAVVPPEILVDTELPEKELIEEFLSEKGRKVRITCPKRGDKRKLLDLTKADAGEMAKTITERAEGKREREKAVRTEMNKVLEMAGYPRKEYEAGRPVRVESYDISNTNGVDSVGAMVVFSGLSKVRKDYRRFKIKTVIGPDDYASLREVIYRRFRRAVEGDASFSQLPDIIMMDGGLGQVTAARQSLERVGLDIPVVGMAKDDSHRTRAIVFESGKELDLKGRPELFSYAGTIQEEVHRFAIEYHRKVRSKNQVKSILDDIEGIGPKRRNDLLAHFGSVEAVKNATEEELLEVASIDKRAAGAVLSYFRKMS